MRILMTGASSFTGTWFARALHGAGHEVHATFTGDGVKRYEGLRRRRVEEVLPAVEPLWGCRLGDAGFLAAVRERGPWDLFCHHAAAAGNHDDPDFPALDALGANVGRLPEVLEALHHAGCDRLLMTGSILECDEGQHFGGGECDDERRAFSAYGLAKALTWQAARFLGRRAGFHVGKFVVPAPFGPLEENGFARFLARSWLAGETPVIRTPAYVRDYIPVDLLALAYVVCAEGLEFEDCANHFCRPAGYVESQAEFAERAARELGRRWPDVDCRLSLAVQTEFPEPRCRHNVDDFRARIPSWDEAAAWDRYAEFCRETAP